MIASAIFYGGDYIVESSRVSVEAIAIAGGALLFVTALGSVGTFSPADASLTAPAGDEAQPPAIGWRTLFGTFARLVLSPIVLPATVTPIGVVALFYFVAATHGDRSFQEDILLGLLQVVGLNFLAMVFDRTLLDAIGLAVLQAFDWMMSELHSALAIQLILELCPA